MKQLPTVEELEAHWRKYPVDDADVKAALLRVPASWTVVSESQDGAAYRQGTLQVILSVSKEQDGNLWLHVSACGRTGRTSFYLPSWEELKRVKNDFIGEDCWAYQVFPDGANYINQNAHVLHLFARYDRQPALPDFTGGLNTI